MRTNCGNEADHTSPHSLHSGVSLQPISAPSSVKTESSKLSFIALGGVRIKTALYSLKSPEEGRACSAYSATKFFQQLWEPHFMTLYPHFTPSLCFLSFYCLSKEKFCSGLLSPQCTFSTTEPRITCYLISTVRGYWETWQCHSGSSVLQLIPSHVEPFFYLRYFLDTLSIYVELKLISQVFATASHVT